MRTLRFLAIFVCWGPFRPAPRARARQFRASLNTFEETPAIVGNGAGHLRLTLHNDMTMDFELTFSGLTGAPMVAHIHIGQRGNAGGVTIFFCGGGGRPACPADTSGTGTGAITAADGLAVPAPRIAPGGLAA